MPLTRFVQLMTCRAVLVSAAVVAFAGVDAVSPASSSDVSQGAAAGYCPGGVLDASRLPRRVAPDSCDLVGRTIRDGSLVVTVPPQGHGMIVSGVSMDGRADDLEVRTSPDGTVHILRSGPRTAAAPSLLGSPSNDLAAEAQPLDSPWAVDGTTSGSTLDSDDSAADDACRELHSSYVGPDTHSVWYSFSAPKSGDLTLSWNTTNTYVFTSMDVLVDAGASGYTAVACGDPDQIHVSAGTTYLFRFGSSAGGSNSFSFTGHYVTAADRPANDDFANALLTDMPTKQSVTKFAYATAEPAEPDPTCGHTPNRTVWYRLQVGTLRRVKVDADQSVALYRGNTLAGLHQVACVANPVAGPFNLSLPATGPYYVQMFAGGTPDFVSFDAADGEAYPGAPNPCDDTTYKLADRILPRADLRWEFNGSHLLGNGITRAQTLASVKAGMAIVTKSKNDCGLADKVSAGTHYLGRTSRDTGLCDTPQHRDGHNTVAVATTQNDRLATACSWTRSVNGRWRIVESDLRIDPNRGWTLQPDRPGCFGAPDLIGVLAHETGHVFGLAHPSGKSAKNQTMWASAVGCNGGGRTLGRGDVAGLRALY